MNCGAADIVGAAGDITTWVYDGTIWNLINWMDEGDTQTGADLAEFFPSAEALTVGQIVRIDTTNPTPNVKKTTVARDVAMVGIVSTLPGVTLDEGGDGKYAIALAGRVPVNVTNEGGAIKVGDFITSSSTSGKGMKATTAGRAIGMALEDFNGTDGQVLVEVMNTWYDPGTGGSADTAKDFFVENRLQLGAQTITIDDNGDGLTNVTATLTPTTSYVEVNCKDGQGCVLNIEETNARSGDLLYLASIGNSAVKIVDRAGIVNGTEPDLTPDDTASFIYTSSKADNLWLQLSTSANNYIAP